MAGIFIDVSTKKGIVRSEYIQNDPPVDRLAVLFPGYGYTHVAPALFYASLIALERGYDLLRIEYGLSEEERENTPYAALDKEALVDCAVRTIGQVKGRYGETRFISKSLGTLIAARASERLCVPANLFLTPIDDMCDYMLAHRCSAVIGTADESIAPWTLQKVLACPHIDLSLLENVTHPLTVHHDARASLSTLNTVCTIVDAFLSFPTERF